jgi:5-methyltetrahydrofolate--homocysteine methyltransferase
MDILKDISENLQQGEANKVAQLTQKALDSGLKWDVILDKGLFAGMQIIGKLFKEEEIFVPEVLMAAKAMEAGQKVLEPLMAKAAGKEKKGKILLGTVKGDVHNLGKDLVDMMLRGAGFEVINLGVDVSEDKFVEAVKKEQPKLVGMSALLTTTMPYMRTTIEALKKGGVRGDVKVIIGGACVTQKYADEIGADGFADNAGAAVDKTKQLLGLK